MSVERKKYARSIEGLRDALFDQLEDLHDGVSSHTEALAFAKVSEVILRTVDVEQRERALQLAERQPRQLTHD